MKRLLILIILNINLITLYPQNDSDTVFISTEPINLRELNSVYDDYNSMVGVVAYPIQRLIFSTNRFSQGKDFDLVSYRLDLIPIRGKENYYKTTYSIANDSILNDMDLINTECNELGPYYKKFNPTHYGRSIDSTLFFITRDCNKNLDIFYAKYQYDTYLATHKRQIDFQGIDFINTASDEGYISISMDYKKIYYCSNINGSFDIIEVSDSLGSDVYQIISTNSGYQKHTLTNINSEYDEKCPFIHWNDWLVFCSNREGGYGGYDLYYSVRKENLWSAPINFGEKINSKQDEFRPIIIERRFMIFSSNRPSGLGGFDLYIVEIKW